MNLTPLSLKVCLYEERILTCMFQINEMQWKHKHLDTFEDNIFKNDDHSMIHFGKD